MPADCSHGLQALRIHFGLPEVTVGHCTSDVMCHDLVVTCSKLL
jgi:hypothetical protein